MTDENNVIDATDKFGPWEGNVDEDGNLLPPVEMSPEEYDSAMTELMAGVDLAQLGRTISGVLEFLTMRAVHDGSYYIMTDDKAAITVIACGDDTQKILDLLPEHFKSWDDEMENSEAEVAPFDSNRDPGDEQDEPATESE